MWEWGGAGAASNRGLMQGISELQTHIPDDLGFVDPADEGFGAALCDVWVRIAPGSAIVLNCFQNEEILHALGTSWGVTSGTCCSKVEN